MSELSFTQHGQKGIVEQFDRLATNYASVKQRNPCYFETLLDVFRSHLLSPGSPILEIGCGTGDILARLSAVPGVGIDMSPEMVARAKAHHPEHAFECQALGHIVLNRTFTNIFLPDILEYVDDLEGAFRNIAVLCAPGGRVVITSPNPAWALILDVCSRLGLKMKDQYSRPKSANRIMNAAKTSGFSILDRHTRLLIPLKNPLAAWVNRWARRIPLLAAGGVMMVFVLERRG